MFGEQWEPSSLDKKKGSAASGETKDADSSSSSSSSGTLLVAGVAISLILTIVLVLVGAGGKTSTNSPKVVMFVISGFKGTEFMNAVVDGPYGPNLKGLIGAPGGSFAACLHADDGRCCRTQDGPRFGADYKFESAPGIASILTGVNSNKHRVNNNSFSAMSNFRQTSAQYPTVLKLAKSAGFSTAVVGSRYMLGALGEDGRCSEYGVVDMECGSDAVSRCLARGSCNSDMRVSLAPGFNVADLAGSADKEVEEYSRASDLLPSDQGRIFEITNDVVSFINAGTDLVVVHINALELASQDKANGGDYSMDSKSAMGALYLIDAVIGQVQAVVESRVSQSRENWMLLGVSDHGGFQSTSGSKKDEDEMVAFFGTTFTLAGHLSLQAPFPPVRQYDAAPTVLKWLGVKAPASMDGSAQMICSDGANPANCTK